MWTKELIKERLLSDDRWVRKAVVAIYERQTTDERQTMDTKYRNGIGYSGSDAAFMSSLAEKIQRGWTLSDKQMFWARKKIVKYAGQLVDIANQKMPQTEPDPIAQDQPEVIIERVQKVVSIDRGTSSSALELLCNWKKPESYEDFAEIVENQ